MTIEHLNSKTAPLNIFQVIITSMTNDNDNILCRFWLKKFSRKTYIFILALLTK